jgi:hypothetical protein
MRVEGKDEVIDLPSYEREVRVAVAPIHRWHVRVA